MAIARTVSVILQSRLNTYENYTCTTFSGKNDLTDNWLLKSQLSQLLSLLLLPHSGRSNTGLYSSFHRTQASNIRTHKGQRVTYSIIKSFYAFPFRLY